MHYKDFTSFDASRENCEFVNGLRLKIFVILHPFYWYYFD